MEARLLKGLAIVLAMIFAIPVAFAINLGTLQKSSDASIASGETAAFRTLFWSSDTEEYEVTINYTEVPKGWLVIILPKQFRLGGEGVHSGKTERIYLPGNKNTIEAQVVDIYITAPIKTVSGEYEITLDAIAGNNESTGFSLFQERKLEFKVNVSGISAEKSEKNDNRTTFISISRAMDEKPVEKPQPLETTPNQHPEKGTNWELPLLLIIAISIIAWRLYKYD